jgi:D-alanine transaminase
VPREAIVYLNGKFCPISEAHISVLDRGFIFGDGVYEVIPAYGGYPFRLQQHLKRLDNSLNAIQIKNPLTDMQWQDSIHQVIEKNSYEDQSIYLQVTRGVAPRDHRFPQQKKPTIFIMTSPLLPQSETIARQGIKAVTLADTRWLNCHIKSISLLPNVLLRQSAQDRGAQEAILIRDGFATEGAASNLFIVKNDCLITPPMGPLLLPGVTRHLIVEIARKQSLCLQEISIREADLLLADEIWLTSSTKEILPVTTLNDKIVGDGKPGKHWRAMMAAYQNTKMQLRAGQHNIF